MKKIFIIVLNFNGCKNTVECMDSLKKVRVPHACEVIPVIVDNGSVDNSVETFKKKFPKNILIETGKNLGYTGGNNVGINFALENGADYIIILNNDTLVERGAIVAMLEAQRQYGADISSPKIYFEKGFEYHKDRYQKKDLGQVFWYAGAEMDWANVIGHHRGVDEVDNGQYDDKTKLEFFTGACFMVKREVFEKVHGFDDIYYLYYEDADLSMKVRRAGFKITFAPKSIILHKNAGSSGGSGSPLQDYYISRNRMVFGMRWAPARTRVALFRESLRILINGRKWQRRGVIDFYRGKLGRGTYPI